MEEEAVEKDVNKEHNVDVDVANVLSAYLDKNV